MDQLGRKSWNLFEKRIAEVHWYKFRNTSFTRKTTTSLSILFLLAVGFMTTSWLLFVNGWLLRPAPFVRLLEWGTESGFLIMWVSWILRLPDCYRKHSTAPESACWKIWRYFVKTYFLTSIWNTNTHVIPPRICFPHELRFNPEGGSTMLHTLLCVFHEKSCWEPWQIAGR